VSCSTSPLRIDGSSGGKNSIEIGVFGPDFVSPHDTPIATNTTIATARHTLVVDTRALT
jgi:hypothetical protein